MGTPHAQVVGTYGERCISGSNLNTYADWNANKEHFGDHNTAAHDPAFFPADPVSAEETAMLTSTPDLTPSCSRSCFWCSDTAGSHPGEPGEILRNLDANGWPDYILQGAYAGQWPLVADPNLLANATARGVKVISIIDVYNDADGSQSRPVSYIDVTETSEFKSHAEFKVEERAGSPPQVAPKCCRAKLSKLSCLLDCSVSFLLRC